MVQIPHKKCPHSYPLTPPRNKDDPAQTSVVIAAMTARYWERDNAFYKKSLSLLGLLIS